MTTERLYYHDSYLTGFRAQVIEKSADGSRIYLDRTAFYPASGGQPSDTGLLGGAAVLDVIDEGERIAHVTGAPVSGEVEGRLDWARRFDHMQQHSGQHLLSAVLAVRFGIPTASFHLGEESSTIDVETASLDPQQIVEAEEQANEAVVNNLAVSVSFEEASQVLDLRRPSGREGPLRVISIEGLDRSACGGTHVRATGEIGPILIRKLEKIRGCVRIEFLCGMRAIRRARADFDALSRIARVYSSPLDQAPALVAVQFESCRAAEKTQRRLAAELARYQGRELYDATPPDAGGIHRAVRRLATGAVDEELRALAKGFTAQAKAVFIAVISDPPAALLAVSGDTGLHAGNLLKSVLSGLGGRGGGNAQIAQGSVPPDSLEALFRELESIGRG